MLPLAWLSILGKEASCRPEVPPRWVSRPMIVRETLVISPRRPESRKCHPGRGPQSKTPILMGSDTMHCAMFCWARSLGRPCNSDAIPLSFPHRAAWHVRGTGREEESRGGGDNGVQHTGAEPATRVLHFFDFGDFFSIFSHFFILGEGKRDIFFLICFFHVFCFSDHIWPTTFGPHHFWPKRPLGPFLIKPFCAKP